MQVWCSVYSVPRSDDSTFIAVFDPQTNEKKMQYTKLESRVSIILPVNNTVSKCSIPLSQLQRVYIIIRDSCHL